MNYDDPRATPEYIDREKVRKRIVNRQAFIRRWWPRIEAEVKEAREREQR